jgi:hypothetical protein
MSLEFFPQPGHYNPHQSRLIGATVYFRGHVGSEWYTISVGVDALQDHCDMDDLGGKLEAERAFEIHRSWIERVAMTKFEARHFWQRRDQQSRCILITSQDLADHPRVGEPPH